MNIWAKLLTYGGIAGMVGFALVSDLNLEAGAFGFVISLVVFLWGLTEART